MTELSLAGRLDEIDADEVTELFDRSGEVPDEALEQVERMAQRIRARGDDALREYTRRFDDVDLDDLVVPDEALERAHEAADDAFLDAIDTAATQIRAYHASLDDPAKPFEAKGVCAREKTVPLSRAGLYVPGGRAAYPSTVLMTAIPAQVAGVDEITLASPPGPEGHPHELVLAAAHHLDVDRVVALGGAQAVLALACGTEQVPQHPVVAGPGNVYVQAAKEHVAGRVRIDAPAGPSEVAVLVGPNANLDVAASELIAQAEHDPHALAVGLAIGDRVDEFREAITRQLNELPRRDIVEQALAERGALLAVDTVDECLNALDRLAPEHCVVLHEEGPRLAERLTQPACIVTGDRARVPLTDYAAGPSHVLPTGGHARAHGGITVATFTKNVHLAQIDDPAPELVEAATHLARLEGFEGHARSIEEDPS